IAARWSTQYPATHRNWSLRPLGYRDSIVDANAQKLMYIMLGAVAFVLLIACANVANLLLARATDRETEIALRAALGAGRGRVVRQLVTESVLLALVGGAAGILVSIWWLDAMVRTIPEELPFWMRFDLDATVLVYTLFISLGTGMLFGLVPALQATRVDLQASLRESARSVGVSRSQNRLRNILVVGEIALSMVLLVGAVLMMQSFMRLQAASPGFDPHNLLSFRVTLAGDQYDGIEARAQYFQRTAERLAQLPGVTGAAATGAIPADDGGFHRTIRADGDPRSADDALVVTEVAAGRNLFAALGLSISAGRDFTSQEIADTAARVAILGERLARRLFPGQDPLNRLIRLGAEGEGFTVIGTAPDLQYEEFGEEEESDRLQLHVPYAQWAGRQMSYLVRVQGDPASLINRVREELRSIDPTLAPWDIQTLDQRRLYTTWEQRIFGKTFGIFGGTALVLALSGVYGVMAYSVARRRREIGVRVALGARPRDVMRLVIGRAVLITAVGVVIGVLAALALTRLLTGLLWGVSVSDPLTFVATPLLLAGAALLASYVPARRATRVDPIIALKAE
ncbi:MAG TPA: FtsX-like permease family protein, partial [Longimicrobiales bacterium]|nr:FtsX-like permease family protein [Longimicrobiales bacterium]